MSSTHQATFFAPHLYIKSGCRDISFYTNGLGAKELRRWSNDDGTIHVAELSIDDNIFHPHEERPAGGQLDPLKVKGVTSLVGLFTEDVDGLVQRAVAAGAILIEPPQSFDYGYRQGIIKDPFGHLWLIQKRIP